MWRADFVRALAGAALVGMSPAAVAAAAASNSKRELWLRREGYGEEIVAPFTLDGVTVYAPGYREICWLMRDHAVPFAQGYVRFDINEIQVLYEVQQALALHGVHKPLIITSGYRTEATNEATEGAARNSQHLYARAVDMYVAGVSNRELFDLCWAQGASGGMGYYDDHVHLDSGTRRWWVGELSVPTFA